MANHYDVPNWAGRAPTGHHLDVTKDDKLIQKLMIDEKKCYLFGRNPHLNDFCIDHGSCSRVHAAMVYHKHLNISYLVDLGSTHGTFIGNLQIDANKPTPLHVDSTFHFGASTRYYVLRERPSAANRNNILEDLPMSETGEGALLGLPESQTELDNLTEYNTAHNRRISMLGITDDMAPKKNPNKPKRKRNVTFNDEDIIINPEDVDPAVGRFRNLIKSTVVPTKRMKFDSSSSQYSPMMGLGGNSNSDYTTKHSVHPTTSYIPHLYEDLPPTTDPESHKHGHSHGPDELTSFNSKFGLLLPNPAPDVAPADESSDTSAVGNNTSASSQSGQHVDDMHDDQYGDNLDEPRKKKYAKEAWPGRKPLLSTF